MTRLTEEQKQRLIDASSKLSKEERSKLTLAQSQEIANRIDKVLHELHMENPLAFVTNAVATLGGVEFVANYSSVRRRKFYNEPMKPAVDPNQYATFEKPYQSKVL